MTISEHDQQVILDVLAASCMRWFYSGVLLGATAMALLWWLV